jgi:hypothetical protein
MARHFETPLVLLALLAVSCRHHPPVPPGSEQREEMGRQLRDFRDYWLVPAKIAPPTVDFAAQRATAGAYVATIAPMLPEDAPWNQWHGGELRLFNNRAGYVFQLTIEGPGPVRWLPGETWLRLNGKGDRLPPAEVPDQLLAPLFGAALDQEAMLVEGDLVERTRAAGPFRAAYLPSTSSPTPLQGVLAFTLPDPEAQVVAFELTVGIAGPDGRQTFDWTFR